RRVTLASQPPVPLLANGDSPPATEPGLSADASGTTLPDATEAASGNGHSAPVTPNGTPAPNLAVQGDEYGLRPFYEALRDRLILFFELRNLTHKPKLVAVTSCAGNAGVSSTAAGLAAALSETGDGNVLLVDMNLHGAAHEFYKGRLGCGLDDALENDKRSHALVQDNLYVVSESSNGDKLPRVLPKRFKHLV